MWSTRQEKYIWSIWYHITTVYHCTIPHYSPFFSQHSITPQKSTFIPTAFSMWIPPYCSNQKKKVVILEGLRKLPPSLIRYQPLFTWPRTWSLWQRFHAQPAAAHLRRFRRLVIHLEAARQRRLESNLSTSLPVAYPKTGGKWNMTPFSSLAKRQV